jgi:5-methylcytosine-specific restriction endonuclease McrA
MIATKLKICSSCNRPSVLWRSTPPTCRACVPRTPIAKSGPSKSKIEKAKVVSKFFSEQEGRIPGCCENCGDQFGFVPQHKLKWLMAHICQKRDIESVMTHPENLMFFCYDCHTMFDRSLSSEIKLMPAYPLIVARFNKFKHLIPQSEYSHIQDYLFELL